MSAAFLIVPILLPILLGGFTVLIPFRSRGILRAYALSVTIVSALFVWVSILFGGEDGLTLLSMTENFTLLIRLDGFGRLFAGIIATLWPLTTLYAFEYLENDPRVRVFLSFFIMSFGVTVGVAYAGNLFTLYCFYELLTLSTVPLVMHTQTRDAVRAAKTYFLFSLGGAAFGFVAMLYYSLGRVQAEAVTVSRLFWLMGFFGFGVKSAIFPLAKWLLQASVAPTPVTALLHAVAVVKSGVFAIIRLTWFAYGASLLSGSWEQAVALSFAAFTVVYGSAMAVKEPHFKRRLAYSTVSNLSYILVGALLLTESGLIAGMAHMAFHASIKILAFFACGAVLHKSGIEYVRELDGLNKKMPLTCLCFTVSALALTGIPPFNGFISKWHLLTAAAESGSVCAYLCAAAILISALLTAIYMLSAVRHFYFPARESAFTPPDSAKDPGALMLIPMLTLAAGLLITGLCSGPIFSKLAAIAQSVAAWR